MKPWLETWCLESDDGSSTVCVPFDPDDPAGGGYIGVDFDESGDAEEIAHERAKLAARAPSMARVLLLVEWSRFILYADNAHGCPSCASHRGAHRARCELDAELTALGFDTQEKRDEARKEIVAQHALETGAFV